MEANVEQAVAVALDPIADPTLKSQATSFCEQVRDAPEGWQICLKLFVKSPKSTLEARFFALQVLEDVLRRRQSMISPEQQMVLRRTLWNWLTQEMDETESSFIRNKFVQILVLLFANQYPAQWPTFFDELASLLSSTSGTTRNALMIDAFLRISLAIDDEVANQILARESKESTRNTHIKDAMRESAVGQLTSAWHEILMSSYQSNPEIANACLRLFARYVTWIDIHLVVTETLISGLYQFLGMEALRMAACECLTEIVGKGMKPADKLNLIQALSITSVLGGLDTDDAEFAEQVAKLVNMLGLEVCRVWEESGDGHELREAAFRLLQDIFPYLVKYLGNEYDDTSSVLLPFLHSYSTVMKAHTKLRGEGALQTIKENLMALLRTIVLKMKYDEDENHEFGQDASDVDALFIEMRQNLKRHLEAIASIDQALFISYMSSAITSTFDKYAQSPRSVSWSEVELSLHLVFLFGEVVKGSAQFTSTEGSTAVLSPLGEMLTKMISSNVSAFPHVSIPIIFFENITRYPQFFELFPQYLPNALESFVNKRGLHHEATFVRSRLFYLFRQFVHALKKHMAPLVDTVLMSIQDLLVVQLPPPSKPSTDAEDVATATSFDSQLYLYEAVGILISIEAIPIQKQAELLTAVLTPLMRQMEEIMQNELYKRDSPPDNIVFTLQLSQLIRAIGNISKGFPDVDHATRVVQGIPAWTVVFQQALGAIVAVLERLHQSELIRDAARFAFQRMVGCMGNDILTHIGPLVTAGLLSNSTRKELVDFLPFIAQITHKFKPAIFPIMNDLFGPLMERIFSSLNQPVDGTDDALSLLELRRGYLNLLAQVFNSDMEGILITEANMPRLNSILQSVLHFVKEAGDPQTQKLAFSVLAKMVISWGVSESGHLKGMPAKLSKKGPGSAKADKGKQPEATPPKSALPGFDQFIYESVVPILFEVPMNPAFNPGDGQCYLVMSEIASLQKTIVQTQGSKYLEFLSMVYLPSIRCPADTAQQFLAALQQMDNKQLRKFLQDFFSSIRS